MGNSVSTQAGAAVASSGRSGGVVVENQPHPEPASVDSVDSARAASVDDCPVLSGKGAANVPVQYNVYNQRIDPRNNMPLAANQAPFPGQKALLSTERIQSNIPKGGTESTWVYPSPQMFYNALKRKGKGDDVEEKDMEAVVQAHNTMNELTWREVYAWEMLHRHECGQPTLLRFLGRPDDFSPLARIRQWFGDGSLPFDRHDWYIDRCGKEVRYVIDFYFDDDKAGSPEAFSLVVRPAVDSPEAVLDRAKMGIYDFCARWGLPCPVSALKSSLPSSGETPRRGNGNGAAS